MARTDVTSTELREGGAATDALHPDVLHNRVGGIAIEVLRRNDHVGGEGFFVPIARSVEVGLQRDGVVVGAD